jgi:small-conductance mechanosensitive channel
LSVDVGGPAEPATKAKPRSGVATSAGPIAVEKRVDDREVKDVLLELLERYPGVRDVDVLDEDGVVTLDGHVEDEETRDEVTEFSRRVEGVRLVLNRMKTDAEVLTAHQMASKVLASYRDLVARKWLLVLVSLVIVLVMAWLARLFNRYGERLLAPFVKNALLRSIVGSVISSIVIVSGILMALSLLDLTHAVLSILGLAGVVGLAVGFAFRDIAENFIASVLLGVRRPFRVGDYIKVAGHEGVVKSLNTRATVLVTLEGNHVRIPNATIFKEILVNTTASSSVRRSFDLLIPYEVSTATALEVIAEVLRGQEGVLAEPPARVLVEALEPGGVRLRASFWMRSRGVDEFELLSDARLRAKVALQRVGITPPPASATLTVAGRVPVELTRADRRGVREVIVHPGHITAEQARANLLHDTRAAAEASTLAHDGRETPMGHVLHEADGWDGEEGTNLLEGGE